LIEIDISIVYLAQWSTVGAVVDVQVRRAGPSDVAVIERIVHAGLTFTDAVDPETSLVICNEREPDQGKGYQALELGIPLLVDADFLCFVERVVGGTGVEEFAVARPAGEQFALF